MRQEEQTSIFADGSIMPGEQLPTTRQERLARRPLSAAEAPGLHLDSSPPPHPFPENSVGSYPAFGCF
jgi:hypothetical protein